MPTITAPETEPSAIVAAALRLLAEDARKAHLRALELRFEEAKSKARAKDWEGADKGRRLDHIWVSPRLADTLSNLRILKEARGWERPSDHVPISIEIAG